MTLTSEEKQALIDNRIRRSYETLVEVEGIAKEKFWHAAANRMYYACYYIVSALLMQIGQTPSTHAGMIRLFGLYFVSTGKVSSEMGSFYTRLYELRQSGDYDDWKTITEKDILPLLPKVKEFIKVINDLINTIQ